MDIPVYPHKFFSNLPSNLFSVIRVSTQQYKYLYLCLMHEQGMAKFPSTPFYSFNL